MFVARSGFLAFWADEGVAVGRHELTDALWGASGTLSRASNAAGANRCGQPGGRGGSAVGFRSGSARVRVRAYYNSPKLRQHSTRGRTSRNGVGWPNTYARTCRGETASHVQNTTDALIYWMQRTSNGRQLRPKTALRRTSVQNGSRGRTRTYDLVVNSHSLYQLSYAPQAGLRVHQHGS